MADKGRGFNALLSRAREVGEFIRDRAERDEILILGHLDADGITATSLIAMLVRLMGGSFQTRSLEQLGPKELEEAASIEKPVVMVDMGSGSISTLSGKMGSGLVVIDHHVPERDTAGDVLQLNPHEFGYEGHWEISASGLAYLVCKAAGVNAKSAAPVAVVGALADLQDKNKERKLNSLNSLIVNDGIELGVVEEKEDLLFFGRETRPIHKALANSYIVPIPNITGNEEAAYILLSNLGIKVKEGERWRTISELSEEEKKKLLVGLMTLFADELKAQVMDLPFVGKVYNLLREDRRSPLRDAREFGYLLNSLGRTGRAALGVAICLGVRGRVLESAEEASREYSAKIRDSLNKVLNVPGAVARHGNLVVIRGEGIIDANLLSPVANMLSNSLMMTEDSLLLAFADQTEDTLKVSARAPETLVRRGISAGNIMAASASRLGGQGGGHPVAAGASIPKKQLQKFIELVMEQYERAASGQGQAEA